MAGYAQSIQTVFLIAVPIAALAFLASWLIPQVELKQWPSATSAAPEPGTAAALESIEALNPPQPPNDTADSRPVSRRR